MKKIVYTRPDGGMTVLHPVINTGEEITEDEAVKRAMKDVPGEASDLRVIEEEAIPDRSFRNAWKLGPDGIEHDMDKAREIHKARLRELRAPKLAALDVAWMLAGERGDDTARKEIAAQKQALRDVTADPALLKAQTTEELKAAIPAVLA